MTKEKWSEWQQRQDWLAYYSNVKFPLELKGKHTPCHILSMQKKYGNVLILDKTRTYNRIVLVLFNSAIFIRCRTLQYWPCANNSGTQICWSIAQHLLPVSGPKIYFSHIIIVNLCVFCVLFCFCFVLFCFLFCVFVFVFVFVFVLFCLFVCLFVCFLYLVSSLGSILSQLFLSFAVFPSFVRF